MKKTVAGVIALLTICLCLLAGCADKLPEKPDDADLEFWIAEDVSNVDFSEYYEIIGWFGAREFYGKGYAPAAVNEDNFAIDPRHYVKYLVTAYPDYSDGGQYVTRIEITDPSVTVYGINCESAFDEFDEAMEKHGYEVTHSADVTATGNAKLTLHTADLGGKAWINLIENSSERKLVIGVEVSNKNNIVY